MYGSGPGPGHSGTIASSLCPAVVSLQLLRAGSAGPADSLRPGDTRLLARASVSANPADASRKDLKASITCLPPSFTDVSNPIISVFCECKTFNPTPAGAQLPSDLLPMLIRNGAGEQIRRRRGSREAEDGEG